MFYLYCNSPATSMQSMSGFLVSVVKKKGREYHSCHTTTEYMFAKEFKSFVEVKRYNTKYNLPCFIMEKKN